METLHTVSLVFLLTIIAAYGIYHAYLAKKVGRRHYYRLMGASSLLVEKDDKIVDNAEALVALSYVADDPMALRFDYRTSGKDFGSFPRLFHTTIDREQVAYALATGSSKNLRDTSDILAIFCSASHRKGKGSTTFTWKDPHGSNAVHILTVPTKDVLKVVNASYAIVAPGEELQEPANNLDAVLEEILQSSTAGSPDADDN